MTANRLEVDGTRFWDMVMTSGEIGPGREGKGLRRLTLTDEDRAVRDLFARWCEEAGLDLTIDRLGNMFARRAGADDSLPPVLIGSHLDTQIAAGKFDGVIGVMAGLEILRTLNDRDITTRRPIEVVNWTNEEGARFNPPMLASGVFGGVYELDWTLARTDTEGRTFGGELERIGYAGAAPVGGRDIDSYFELHIEQGPELERREIPVGIVSGTYSMVGMRVHVHGTTAHAGPTEMGQRRNALVGAAMAITAVNDIGWAYAPEGKTTSTQIRIWPNLPGLLPDFAEVLVDMRHPDPETTQEMASRIEAALQDAAETAQVGIEFVERWEFGGETFDPECVACLREAAEDLGVKTADLYSQAGHDAYYVSRVAPVAMLFSPCRNGVSHNEAEDATLEQTLPAVNLLLNAVLKRADR